MTRGRTKCMDLTYLTKRTKANPELMMEMIELYLDQTPLSDQPDETKYVR